MKAFDTLNQSFLFNKKRSLGFIETVIEWFQSYLKITEFFGFTNVFPKASKTSFGFIIFLLNVNRIAQVLALVMTTYMPIIQSFVTSKNTL